MLRSPAGGMARNPLFYRARRQRAETRRWGAKSESNSESSGRAAVINRRSSNSSCGFPAEERGRRFSLGPPGPPGPITTGDGQCQACLPPRVTKGTAMTKAARGGCHRLSGSRRVGAPRGQHFQDDTESCRAAQHRPCQ
jgi:hypothetical protein